MMRILMAISLAWAGCDSVIAGQTADDTGKPQLMRILVQDETPGTGLGLVTDLLDESEPIKCSETEPCPAVIAGGPGLPCNLDKGVCPNPYAAGPVEIGVPDSYGGISIRLVFNKLLDSAFETVSIDGDTNAYSYKLADGVVALNDADGKVVATVNYWDPSGFPKESADPTGIYGVPFGPAIVMKPKDPLSPNSKYTLVLDPTKVKDRAGHSPANRANVDLPNPYQKQFATEDLQVRSTAPDLTAPIRPNNLIQLRFNAGIDLASAAISLKKGAETPQVEAWLDRGGDPEHCKVDDRRLDLVAVSAPGKPVDLTPGSYDLTVILKDNGRGEAKLTYTAAVTVMGPNSENDSAAVTQFVLPQQCVN